MIGLPHTRMLDKRTAFWAGFILLLLIFIWGCGRKGPPVPPPRLSPPKVVDLKATVEGDLLTLWWSVPSGIGKQQKQPTGFFVFRAKEPLSEDECRKCPVHFTQIARISAKRKKSGAKMVYHEHLERGYVYTYKVVSYARTGIQGGASNIVKIRW